VNGVEVLVTLACGAWLFSDNEEGEDALEDEDHSARRLVSDFPRFQESGVGE
jgi:hypothetical protein